VVRRFSLAAVACVLVSTLALAQPPQPKPRSTQANKATKKPSPARYGEYVRKWHAPVPNKLAPVDAAGKPMLALYSLNTNDRAEMPAGSEHGGFSAQDLDRAAFVLREPSSGAEHPIEPRLLDLVYRIQSHFHAQEVRIVSSYRAPRRKRTSNHGHGRAIDLIVPGTTDDEVAKYARELGFVGVGVYPTSGFVHVDVRQRSYFWIDRSGPGRRNREKGILGDLASRSDAQALSRGERPAAPVLVGGDVDAWLRTRPATAPINPPPMEEDDDDDAMPETGNTDS
jgi:uncharacterized protein YcbK (DUF882 family)